MNMTPRYSLDDTIMEDPVKRVSMKIKGVTYFDRQTNLKSLYEQHLKKEDKHLTLEKFFVGNTQTLRLLFNGLEIGTIPEEHLNMFYSYHFNYELSNIHIDFFTNEYGKIIYWAKLFVIFTPKQRYSHAIINVIPKKRLQNRNQPPIKVQKNNLPDQSNNENDYSKESAYICLSIIGAFFSLFLGIVTKNIFFFIVMVALLIIAVSYIAEVRHKSSPYLQIYPTKDEVKLIEKFRRSSIAAQEWILFLLNNPTKPQKPKEAYTRYSTKELKFLYAYRNAPFEIQNKVKEALEKQATHA